MLTNEGCSTKWEMLQNEVQSVIDLLEEKDREHIHMDAKQGC